MTGLYQFLADKVESIPDRPLIYIDGEEIRYRQALAEVDRRAAMLRDLGVNEGDRVAVLLESDPELIYYLFASAKLNATFVPLDYRQESDVLDYLLADADPRVLLVGQAAYEPFRSIRDSVDIEHVFVHQVDDSPEASISAGVQNAPDPTTGPVDVSRNDIAVVNYTSGTTGPPKGVLNPHYSFVDAGRRAAEACGTDQGDRALLVLPLFHANPLTYGLMHMLAVGGSVALVKEFSASAFWETARESKSTFFTHVGSVLEILTNTYRNGEFDEETPLEFAMGGAAHFDEASQRWFEDMFDLQIIRLYGMSELGAGLVTLCERYPEANHAPTNQGPVEETPFDIRIFRQDDCSFAEAGETGEIVVRPEQPATMFKGYWNKAETTVDDWEDLWMHTGDLGRIEDGNLSFLGRIGMSIRKGGENISPWEIESTVERFDGVAEAVAVGVSDETLGEAVHLYVVPADDADLVEETVHDQCVEELASHLIPRYVSVVESIPRTSTQKTERTVLSNRGTDEAWDAKN